MFPRRWWGPLLLLVLIAGGHLIRRQLLVGPAGHWRDSLWLDDLLPPTATARAADTSAAPRVVTPSRPLAINLAPADSLQALPGVGPVLARRIVAERQQHGFFREPADLVRVRGIGARTAARLAPLLDFKLSPVETLRSRPSPPGR